MSRLRKYGEDAAVATEGVLPKTTEVDPTGFRAALMAHEMGHATDFEGRRMPALRQALERGLWLGGQGASYLAQYRGRPGVAAVGKLLAAAPEVFSEGVASRRGYNALKESGKYTPEELKKVRNTLLSAGSTYVAPPVIGALDAAATAALQRSGHLENILNSEAVIPYLLAPHALSMGVGAGLGALFDRQAKKSPSMGNEEAEALRQQMGVKGNIYRGVDEIGSNAFYVPPGQHEGWGRKGREKDVGQILHEDNKNKKLVRQLLEQGGIIAPHFPGKEKKGEEKPKKKSLIGRMAKGLGLGAVTLGTGAGLVAASDPEGTKKFFQTVKAWRQARGTAKELGRALKTMKVGSAAPASCETLSSAHWPTLAKVLVK